MVEKDENEAGITSSIPPSEGKKLLSSIDDMQAFDRELWEVTKGLPIRTGSVFRVPSEHYLNWGINLTDDTKERVKEIGEEFRLKDYDEKRRRPDIEAVEKTPFSMATRQSMARVVAMVVKEFILAMDDGKREFSLCDLACGRGKTSTAIATMLRMDPRSRGIMDRVNFHLVDHSGEKLYLAQGNLESMDPNSVRMHAMSDEEFLNEAKEKFDIIVSISHLHKKPFASDVLNLIESNLADNGALVSADWHSSLCKHPFYVYQMLERMGIESRRLDMYKSLLGDLLGPDSCPSVTAEELKAVADHQDYWAEVHRGVLQSGPRTTREPRYYFLGAFDTSRERVAKIEKAGLVTDIDKIRTAFPKARFPALPKHLQQGTDRVAVIAGVNFKG